MLLPAKDFKTFKLRAKDGDIGKAKEFFFDDHFWTVRYLVADTADLADRALGPNLPLRAQTCQSFRKSFAGGFDQKADRGKSLAR